MSNDITLDDLIDILGQHAHQMLIKLGEPSLMPLYHIHGDEVLAIGCPWKDETEKLQALAVIKHKAKEVNATMIGFVCEAWTIKHDTLISDMSSITPPSQSPNRIEVVMVMVTDGDNTKSKAWQIMRNEAGGIMYLAPIDQTRGLISGRMIDDLLPRKNKAH